MVKLTYLRVIGVFSTNPDKGAGALVSPLVATQFSVMRHWSFHYLVALGIVTVNAVMTSAIFRLQSQQGTFVLNRNGTLKSTGSIV